MYRLICSILFIIITSFPSMAFKERQGLDNFVFSPDTAVIITDLQGQIDVLPSDKEEHVQVKTGDIISLKDKLISADNSRCKMVFSDGSTLKIGSSTEIEFCDREKITMSSGKLWGNIKDGSNFNIITHAGTAVIKGTEMEIEGTENSSTLTVIKGTVEFFNNSGSLLVREKTVATATADTAPSEIKRLSDDEILKKLEWSSFGNPRVMVLIEEVNFEKKGFITEGTLNSSLSDNHYHLIDETQINAIRETDEAKKGLTGDAVSAATLGKRLQSDIIVIGKVATEFVGQMSTSRNTLFTSNARCDIRVVISDTGQIILAKTISQKGTSLSREEAGNKAIKKMADIIVRDIVWEIPVNYTVLSNSHRAIQIIVSNCDFTSRDKIIEHLKQNPVTGNHVYPRSFENSIAIIDIEYIGTSDGLAGEILKISDPKISVTGVTMNRIEISVNK
ncbi:MAG: FecR family protein [Candidatus Eremiobacterota bacterium]